MFTAAEINHEISVMTLGNEITASLEKQLQDLISKSVAKTIILDFYHIDLFDDSSLSTLVRLHNVSRGCGKRLLAARLAGQLADIFGMARLNEGIPVFDTVREAAVYAGFPAGLPVVIEDGIKDAGQRPTLKTYPAWPGPFTRLSVRGMPPQAINLNVDGRRVAGPLQGFGRLWQKTYTAVLDDIKLSPGELIEVLKTNFTRFQPPANRFYTGPEGIKPGEVILINADTPGGLVATGVMVLYAGGTSFTFITPEGHPESGWVTFRAEENDGRITIQIQGLARASDPVYEAAFRLAGSKLQQEIWTHVLQSLLRHIGSNGRVEVIPLCLDRNLQWSRFGNIFANAQALTILHLPAIVLRNLIKPGVK